MNRTTLPFNVSRAQKRILRAIRDERSWNAADYNVSFIVEHGLARWHSHPFKPGGEWRLTDAGLLAIGGAK